MDIVYDDVKDCCHIVSIKESSFKVEEAGHLESKIKNTIRCQGYVTIKDCAELMGWHVEGTLSTDYGWRYADSFAIFTIGVNLACRGPEYLLYVLVTAPAKRLDNTRNERLGASKLQSSAVYVNEIRLPKDIQIEENEMKKMDIVYDSVNDCCYIVDIKEKLFNIEEVSCIQKEMDNIINSRGHLTLYDFAELIDKHSECDFGNDYGWTSLESFGVVPYPPYNWCDENLEDRFYISPKEPAKRLDKLSSLDEFLSKQFNMSADAASDIVNHPDHYKSPTGLEVIDVIKAFTSDLQGIEATDTGNIIKYICRWKNKNGIEDLKKAEWYLRHLINAVQGGKK